MRALMRSVSGGRSVAVYRAQRVVYPLPLANRLFLCTHDAVLGSARADARLVSVALAAGLVAELISTRHVTIHAGRIRVASIEPPYDPVCRSVADWLRHRPRFDATESLTGLADSARDAVAERCVAVGLVTRVASRWGAARYPACHPEAADWLRVGLAARIRRGVATASETVAGALLQATGLRTRCLSDPPDPASLLPPPAYLALVDAVRAATDTTVATA